LLRYTLIFLQRRFHTSKPWSAKLIPFATLFFLAIGIQACRTTAVPQDEAPEFSLPKRTVFVGEKLRSFIEFIPETCLGKECALVLIFHGGHGDALPIAKLTNFESVAKKNSFIAVFPSGYENQWNDGRSEINPNTDDVAFVDQILGDIKARTRIDPKRIYATGLSNGGLFSFRLACERSEVFAAVAPVAALLGEKLSKACKPSQPISVFNMMGDADRLMPSKGGFISGPVGLKKIGRVLSIVDTTKFWQTKNGCKETPVESTSDQDTDDGTQILKQVATNCSESTEVSTWVIQGGGHTWPGGAQYMAERWIGKTSKEFDAAEEIWQFFSQHPKKQKN
jgi:polyhydroxybutyrate depolymerase